MGSSRAFATNSAQRGLQALGRLKPGELNRTEQRYVSEVLDPAKTRGEIVWSVFEGIKLRLADRTFLTPDFAIMLRTGLIELHDVKGARAIYMDDAKVKMKVAAETYPFVFKVAFPPRRKGDEWEVDTL